MYNQFVFFPICPMSHLVRIFFLLCDLKIPQKRIISNTQFLSFLETHSLPQFFRLPLLFKGEDAIYGQCILQELNNHYYNEILREYFNNQKVYNEFSAIFSYFNNEIYMQSIYSKLEVMIYTDNAVDRTVFHAKNRQIYQYLDSALRSQDWYMGSFSIVDLGLFCHFTLIDYCSQISWILYPNLKKWYMRMKCNKSYNFILQEKVHTMTPPSHFAFLDF